MSIFYWCHFGCISRTSLRFCISVFGDYYSSNQEMAQPSESRNSALPIKLDTVASLFYDLAMFRWSLTDNMPKALYSKNMGVHSV